MNTTKVHITCPRTEESKDTVLIPGVTSLIKPTFLTMFLSVLPSLHQNLIKVDVHVKTCTVPSMYEPSVHSFWDLGSPIPSFLFLFYPLTFFFFLIYVLIYLCLWIHMCHKTCGSQKANYERWFSPTF